jgi:hypothetical protein
MSKAQRIRERTSREKIAAQQAAARQAERRRVLVIGGGSVAVVLAIVAVIVSFALSRHNAKQGGSGAFTAAIASEVTHVPPSTLAAVGTGALPAASSLPIRAITDTPLTAVGKPQMLYIGAEYCPYCAAMRWSMAIALSRFGTLGQLTGIHSSATDAAGPNTATLTFAHQAYSSPYLTFTPVEHQNVQGGPLQPITGAQNALWVKYDTSGGSQGYPFIDFGNKVVLTGPTYNPLLLHGLTWAQIAGQLKDPNSTVAKNIDGTANYLTAAICKMTGNKPGSVCTAAPIPAIEANL